MLSEKSSKKELWAEVERLIEVDRNRCLEIKNYVGERDNLRKSLRLCEVTKQALIKEVEGKLSGLEKCEKERAEAWETVHNLARALQYAERY